MMSVEDEPLDGFYPTCWECGETITGDGYKIGECYYCEDCVKTINGTDEAINRRDARFEMARESLFK